VKIEVLEFGDIPDKMEAMEEFVGLAHVIPLDDAITERAIALRREYKKLKLGDAIIAATTLEYNLTLITHNIADFRNIAGLNIRNSYLME
jgi:predicted nucleic acid-binding protein